jgi:hypothetical protein
VEGGEGGGLWADGALFRLSGGVFFAGFSGHDFEQEADGAFGVDGDFVDVGFGGEDA